MNSNQLFINLCHFPFFCFSLLLFRSLRKNPFKAQNLYLSDDKRLRKSNFNFNHPLVIYLHGFSESATSERQSSQEIKDGKRQHFFPFWKTKPVMAICFSFIWMYVFLVNSFSEKRHIQCHTHRLESLDGRALVHKFRGQSTHCRPLHGPLCKVSGAEGFPCKGHPFDWLQFGCRGGGIYWPTAAGMVHIIATHNG